MGLVIEHQPSKQQQSSKWRQGAVVVAWGLTGATGANKLSRVLNGPHAQLEINNARKRAKELEKDGKWQNVHCTRNVW